MEDQTDSSTPKASATRSGARRVFGWAAGTVITLVLVLAVIRVFITTISPDQKAPDGHFGKPCALCHLVSESAKLVDVE